MARKRLQKLCWQALRQTLSKSWSLHGTIGHMGEDDRGTSSLTFRKPWGPKVTVAAWSVAAIGIGLQVFFTGREALNNPIVPWLLLMAWAAYMMAWRPRLTVSESGFEMCNGEKTHYIPFPAIEDVQNRYRVVITAHGKRYVSQVGSLPGEVAVGAQSNEDPISAAWLNAHFGQGRHESRVVTRRNYALTVVGVLPLIWFFALSFQMRPFGFN